MRTRASNVFRGRRIVLFALPGAFTPTCGTTHVPGYVTLFKELRHAGLDDIICLSVNHPYVMEAWQREEKAQDLYFMSDPFGEFTEAIGISRP
jgi:peroxiredoxin